jgi:3-hydroxyisobutyrate dehydrogenase/2-hydroxy-3-oxopropionate reductase
MTTVAIVGTGRMGSAMARAISRAGHDLVLQNRTTATCMSLAAQLGCRAVQTAAEAAAAADVTITMLADDDAVEATFRGPDGLIAGAHAGGVLVDCSTVTPGRLRSLESDVRRTGSGLLDSPVSGSVSLAENGKLTLMVGGTAEDLERARPALDAIAASIFHLGPLGTGAAMKLAVNAIVFGLSNAVAEGLVLAERAGIDRALAYDVIAAGAAGAPLVGYKRAAFVDPDATPVAFSLDLAAKDLRLIADLARSLGVPLEQAAVNLELIEAAAADLGGDRDFSAVASHLRASRLAPEAVPAGAEEGR